MKVGPMFVAGLALTMWIASLMVVSWWALCALPAACMIGLLTEAIDARMGWQKWRLW